MIIIGNSSVVRLLPFRMYAIMQMNGYLNWFGCGEYLIDLNMWSIWDTEIARCSSIYFRAHGNRLCRFENNVRIESKNNRKLSNFVALDWCSVSQNTIITESSIHRCACETNKPTVENCYWFISRLASQQTIRSFRLRMRHTFCNWLRRANDERLSKKKQASKQATKININEWTNKQTTRRRCSTQCQTDIMWCTTAIHSHFMRRKYAGKLHEVLHDERVIQNRRRREREWKTMFHAAECLCGVPTVRDAGQRVRVNGCATVFVCFNNVNMFH